MGKVMKKRVLILGASGMLGHKLCQLYNEKYDIYYTVRSEFKEYARYGFFDKNKMIEKVNILDLNNTSKVIKNVNPDILINCIGIIKQLKEANNSILSIKINSLLPQELAEICRSISARFFHISTDCVFDGKRGMYTEQDISNAEDLYGKTKFLGEVRKEGCLTLRTSIIGRELNSKNGLVEWFLSNKGGKVNGFQKAIYTGFSTIALAGIIENLIDNFSELSGLFQVSSEPIDKLSLLKLIKDEFCLDVEIYPETETFIDRSLDSSRFRKATGFAPPSWKEMIHQMSADETPYDKWHEIK